MDKPNASQIAGAVGGIYWTLILLLICVGKDYTWNVGGVSGHGYSSWRVGILGEPWLKVERLGVGTLENVVWGEAQWVFQPNLVHLLGVTVVVACFLYLRMAKERGGTAAVAGDVPSER